MKETSHHLPHFIPHHSNSCSGSISTWLIAVVTLSNIQLPNFTPPQKKKMIMIICSKIKTCTHLFYRLYSKTCNSYRGIHPIHLLLFLWCTHKAPVLFHLPFSFPLGVRPLGLEPHTPLISSSCLFYWVIGSIMRCGIYLWAKMLCSAHWGHSCQQECQKGFIILRWICEKYILM